MDLEFRIEFNDPQWEAMETTHKLDKLLLYKKQKGEAQICTLVPHSGLKWSVANLAFYENWSKSWSIIVPGHFGGEGETDLFFYDKINQMGAFYTCYNSGIVARIGHLQLHLGDWDVIIATRLHKVSAFRNKDSMTDLLFYSKSSYSGYFYSTDGRGNLATFGSFTHDKKNTWDIVVPGDFGSGSECDDFMMYDRNRGELIFYEVSADASHLKELCKISNINKNWTHIIVDNFIEQKATTSDLLFYDKTNQLGAFYSVIGIGRLENPENCLKKEGETLPDMSVWDYICSGSFGSKRFSDLFFYNKSKGLGVFCSVDGKGNFTKYGGFSDLKREGCQIFPIVTTIRRKVPRALTTNGRMIEFDEGLVNSAVAMGFELAVVLETIFNLHLQRLHPNDPRLLFTVLNERAAQNQNAQKMSLRQVDVSTLNGISIPKYLTAKNEHSPYSSVESSPRTSSVISTPRKESTENKSDSKYEVKSDDYKPEIRVETKLEIFGDLKSEGSGNDTPTAASEASAAPKRRKRGTISQGTQGTPGKWDFISEVIENPDYTAPKALVVKEIFQKASTSGGSANSSNTSTTSSNSSTFTPPSPITPSAPPNTPVTLIGESVPDLTVSPPNIPNTPTAPMTLDSPNTPTITIPSVTEKPLTEQPKENKTDVIQEKVNETNDDANVKNIKEDDLNDILSSEEKKLQLMIQLGLNTPKPKPKPKVKQRADVDWMKDILANTSATQNQNSTE